MAKKYLHWTGAAFLIVAALELVFKQPFGGLLYFTTIHFAFDALVAVVAVVLSVNGSEAVHKAGSVSVASVLLLTFLAVMVAPDAVSGLLGYPVGWPYLVIHLTSGVAGLIMPFLGKRETGQTVVNP